jgi:DNA-binding CsgD family transcriptional regulator
MLGKLAPGDVVTVTRIDRLARSRDLRKAHGPSPFLTPAQQKEAMRWRGQGATLDELARSHNVSRATISRLAE